MLRYDRGVTLQVLFTTKLMKILPVFFSLITIITSVKRSEVQIAIVLIDQELDFIEHIIVTSREYNAFSFLDEYLDHLKASNAPYPPEKMKRLLLLHKCWSMVGERMNYFLNKHNSIYHGYFDNIFPEGQKGLKSDEDLRKEHVQFSADMKHFFLNQVPNNYVEYGQNMGVNFTVDELESDMKHFKEFRERGDSDLSNFAKLMGVKGNNTGH